jgi:hypothetical protein
MPVVAELLVVCMAVNETCGVVIDGTPQESLVMYLSSSYLLIVILVSSQ